MKLKFRATVDMKLSLSELQNSAYIFGREKSLREYMKLFVLNITPKSANIINNDKCLYSNDNEIEFWTCLFVVLYGSEVLFKVGNISYGRADFDCLCLGKTVGEEVSRAWQSVIL